MLSTGETWFPQQYSQPIHIFASWPASSPVSLVGEDKLGHWDPFFFPLLNINSLYAGWPVIPVLNMQCSFSFVHTCMQNRFGTNFSKAAVF